MPAVDSYTNILTLNIAQTTLGWIKSHLFRVAWQTHMELLGTLLDEKQWCVLVHAWPDVVVQKLSVMILLQVSH